MTNEELKKLGDEVATLRNELAALRKGGGGGGGGGNVMSPRHFPVPPIVSEAEIKALEDRLDAAIQDPDQGVDPVNKQYVRPILEIIASTARLRFDEQPELPPVNGVDRTKLTALSAMPVDESKLDWNVNKQ